MILVTLGTQKEQFSRLLEYIDNSNIAEKIIVQAGYTKYNPKKKNMIIIDFISYDEMSKYVDEAKLIITHSGTGSVLAPLKKGKKVIVCSRLSKYGEHVDDHQKELTDVLLAGGYILELNENNSLNKLLDKIDDFKPVKYNSNTDKFIKELKKEIEEPYKRESYLILVLFVAFIALALLFLTFRKQKDVSILENRTLNKIELSSVKEIFNGNFQKKLEAALPDQLILSETLKKYGNKINKLSTNISIKLFFDKNMYDIIPVKNGLYKIFGSDYLVYSKSDISSLINGSKEMLSIINKVQEKFSSKKVYVFKVTRETDFEIDDEYTLFVNDFLNDNTKYSSLKGIDSYDDYKKYFYKSDHHWNNYGQYEGYNQIADLLGITNKISIESVDCFDVYFRGSKARQVGDLNIMDQFCVNNYDLDEFKLTVNGEDPGISKNRKRYYDKNVLKYSNASHYSDFYGLDYGEMIYEFKNNRNKNNILVFVDSYSNPINELIASNYNNSYFIDLRNYENLKGKKFVLSDYLKEHDVDEILFLGNINFFVMNEFHLEIGV